MKKLMNTALLFALVFSMTACGKPQIENQGTEPETTPQTEQLPEEEKKPEVNQEELLAELKYSIELLDLCFDETCGAELNREVAYSRVYSSMDAMINGEELQDVIRQDEITEETDAASMVLYEITNYKTNDEVRADLGNYFTEQVVNDVFPDEFIEFNGKLYMGYGGRGYGMHDYDLDSAVIVELSENTCQIDVDYLMMDEPSGTASIYFEKTGDQWLITGFQE